MKTLSGGMPSTLGSYRDIATAVFGEQSKAVEFLEAKIAEQGVDEEVVLDEGQMLHLLMDLHLGPL